MKDREFVAPASSLCELAASGQEGVLEAYDENGKIVLAGHHYLPELGLSVIVKVEKSEIFQPLRLFIAVLVGMTVQPTRVFLLCMLTTSRCGCQTSESGARL